MNPQELQKYLLPSIIVGYFIWRFLKFKKIKHQIPELIRQGAVIIDVRSESEFGQASNAQSLNIPLNDLQSRLKELSPNQTLILCCASGTRSGMALRVLKANGFKNLINAGSWTNTMP